MPLTPEQFIAGLGLAQEQADALRAAIGSVPAEKFTGFMTAQEAEAAAKAAREQAAQEALESTGRAEQALVAWRGQAQQTFERALESEKAAAAAREAALRSEVRRLASEYFIPEEAIAELAGPAATTKVAPAAATPANDPRYATVEQLKQLEQAGIQLARTPELYFRVVAEHQKLFPNETPDYDRIFKARADSGNRLSLMQAWEKVYDVPAKRESVRAAEVQANLDAAVKKAQQETEARVRSELALEHPGTVRRQNGDHHSALLQMAARATQPPATNPTAPAVARAAVPEMQRRNERVMNAVRAFEQEYAGRAS